MSLVFGSFALIHLLLSRWAAGFWRRRGAPGALILAILAAGLFYDNSIIALGSTLGLGSLLETLSWPRFILHAVVTPFLMIATLQIAATAELEWAAMKFWQAAVWIITLVLVAYGIVYDVLPLELQPACFNDVVRYTSSASPAQFCLPDQVQNPGVGPPIPSIVADFMIIIVGAMLWRRKHLHWMCTGGVLMLLAAAFPANPFGLAVSNFGEVLLTCTLVMTSARFSGRRK